MFDYQYSLSLEDYRKLHTAEVIRKVDEEVQPLKLEPDLSASDIVKTREFDPAYEGLRKHIVQRYLEISKADYEVACQKAEDTARWHYEQFGDTSESFADMMARNRAERKAAAEKRNAERVAKEEAEASRTEDTLAKLSAAAEGVCEGLAKREADIDSMLERLQTLAAASRTASPSELDAATRLLQDRPEARLRAARDITKQLEAERTHAAHEASIAKTEGLMARTQAQVGSAAAKMQELNERASLAAAINPVAEMRKLSEPAPKPRAPTYSVVSADQIRW